ncbi:DNA-methyltransferase [Brachyspira catarrhinii]|uniref:Methyltransferase n=1 Tax=Brachyspira catarrhinii TaxID=2528966 RepID=A0ABY2TU93_9SPIR|nr:site-specific DNA-methyltransferase [Brachyspira catarrhinii]TKZ36355.1 site-specific DNA-methyltransferase [Brachyspira catarrhinii]
MYALEELKNKIICDDNIRVLSNIPNDSIDLIITSPPYFKQRDYGYIGIGNENTVDEYINKLILVFKECKRIIKSTGSIVFNIGDKYTNGNLNLIPYRFAIEAQKIDNIRLINELTWVKINPSPRQNTKKLVPATEPFFIFTKSKDYYFDNNSFLEYKNLKNKTNTIKNSNIGQKYFNIIDNSTLSNEEKKLAYEELDKVISEVKSGKIESFRMKIRGVHALPYGGQSGGRLNQIQQKGFTIIKIYGNSMKKDIIESTVETIKGNKHPAIYPEFIVGEIIKLLTKKNSIILDPFLGSGTTCVVAKKLNRFYIGIEIFNEYVEYSLERLNKIENMDMEILV